MAVAAAREVGGVDASLVFSAKLAGFDLGLLMLRRSGLFVAVGLPASSEGNFQLNRTAALAELGDVFDELESGRYVGRAVITDFGA